MATGTSSASEVMQSLVDATNRHDLAALVDCFAQDFVNDTPAHPSRCFTGVERVRKNWSLIFAAVPDLEAEVVRRVCEADTVWTEWEMRGTRVDGSRHLMRGVTIFGVKQGRFEWVRFYLEPVDGGAAGVDQALRQQLGR
ncbi:MAG TPA: nuclear transport factor 2 family protein [Candidatus Dormibacteraeota bacterium]|nr:nuclear transport factor 2 family protein [Candidatus Dormibacteraeota bacterium]